MSRELLNDLRARGLIFQIAGEDDLPDWLDGGMRTVYCGFDPTADSLHIGSLVPLLMLRRFQLAGHKPLALVGGATGLIGGIELETIPGKPTARAFDAFLKAYDKGILIRTTGDIIALSPPLIISKAQIDELVGTLADALREVGRNG